MDGSRESATSPVLNQSPTDAQIHAVSSPQQKPVNLLPEIPLQTTRPLTEREQRDCEVIGNLI